MPMYLLVTVPPSCYNSSHPPFLQEYSPSVDEYIGGSVDDESSIQNEEDEEDCEEVMCCRNRLNQEILAPDWLITSHVTCNLLACCHGYKPIISVYISLSDIRDSNSFGGFYNQWIEDLKKEGELPLEDLIVLYGLNKEDDYTKFKQESRDSETDTESVTHGARMSMYDKDDWKKEISIGPEFQAEIPPLQDKSNLAEETEDQGDTLLWRPDKLNSDDLYKYLSSLYSKEELPIEDFHRDDEQTDTSKQPIITRYLDHVTGYQPIRDQYYYLSNFQQNFELGLKMFGKQFHLIHKNNVPSRKISEIIQFYYLWKKTERYDIFIRYSKIGSKRYIFNPGLSLDFERSNCTNGVMGEEEGEEEGVQVEVRSELTPQQSTTTATATSDPETIIPAALSLTLSLYYRNRYDGLNQHPPPT
eukprot:sb/3465096/